MVEATVTESKTEVIVRRLRSLCNDMEKTQDGTK